MADGMQRSLRVIVGCEESGVVRDAMLRGGA